MQMLHMALIIERIAHVACKPLQGYLWAFPPDQREIRTEPPVIRLDQFLPKKVLDLLSRYGNMNSP